MSVVDASVLVTALGSDGARGRRALTSLAAERHLDAPHLINLEFASGLRKARMRGELDDERATAALGLLDALAVRLYPHGALMLRIWDLRRNLSPYDAAYVALAETLETRLITLDAALARAPGPRCEIKVVA